LTDESVEGRPLDEAQHIADARKGDLNAFEELVRIYQHDALRLAYLLVRDHGEAEDVAQEALVKAYRAMGRLRPEASFRPWLLAIVRNEASNRRRSRGRRLRLIERVGSEPSAGDAAPSPETAVVSRTESDDLVSAVDRLPEKHRLVVVCRYFLGLSETETAEVLGIPPGTVKSRCSRALQQLKTTIGGEDA
jgi:RNA polymerase sigma-70 factor (ECF subfamily)